MPRLLGQIGVLKLEDEEFEILLDIFSDMKQEILLASAYMTIKYQYANIVIPDSVIAELKRIKEQPELPENKCAVITKVLDFRRNATITI